MQSRGLMPEFRQEDADELHRVSGAVFGAWDRRADGGPSDRVPGIIERLDSMETLIKRGVAAASAVGALVGSLLTIFVQRLMGMH